MKTVRVSPNNSGSFKEGINHLHFSLLNQKGLTVVNIFASRAMKIQMNVTLKAGSVFTGFCVCVCVCGSSAT